MSNNELRAEAVAKAAALARVPGIRVEVCGFWVWVTGETRSVRDQLKAAGCRWASRKGAWYWRNRAVSSGGHRPMPLDYIRARYGSARVDEAVA
jgi:hypothetical protein